MAKITSKFSCVVCQRVSSQWLGRCPQCQEWNSFEEIHSSKNNLNPTKTESSESIIKLKDIVFKKNPRISTGINEFDRVLGGGLNVGSLVLIGGEPGVGKSTLLGMAVSNLAKLIRKKVLYVSGEESLSQIGERLNRISNIDSNLYIYHDTIWENIKEKVKKLKPDFLVIDSIQTTISHEIASPPGSINQIREVTYELINFIKSNDITCFVVGHITKEGNIAGPKILEHMVDTVIYFEGDQNGQYRILRAIKNRFGPTNEVGIFEMRANGLVEVANPAQYFRGEHLENSCGRAIACLLEGSRSLFVEVQSLVVVNKYGNGRRTTQGYDPRRLMMIIAIMEKYLGVTLSTSDIYLNIVGGLKMSSHETDLAILASLISSYYSRPISSDHVFLGELGLSGEVRTVQNYEKRIKEMSSLNYKYLFTSLKIEEELNHTINLKIKGLTQASELKNLI